MTSQGNQASQDLATIIYRLNFLEQQVSQLHSQLQLYVPVRENELQLQAIKSAVDRIEEDVKDTKKQVGEMKDSQDKLQIRVLIGIVTTVVTILSGIVVAYIAHFF
jgi:hypothetical protein